jgi:WD40 repeat protein
LIHVKDETGFEVGTYAEEIEEDFRPGRGRLVVALVVALVLVAGATAVLVKVLTDQRQQASDTAATAVAARGTAEAQVTAQAARIEVLSQTIALGDARPVGPVARATSLPGEIGPASAARARSVQLAYAALAQLDVDPERSVLVAIDASNAAHTPESEDALRRALAASHVRLRLQSPGGAIQSAEFSPNGDYIVTTSTDGPARVWDAHTGQELFQLTQPGQALSASYSPDGRFILTTSTDKTARVWDASTGAQLSVLGADRPTITVAQFSPDAQRVATGSWDGTVRIWSAQTITTPRVLRGGTNSIERIEWSPNGGSILAMSPAELSVWSVFNAGDQLLFMNAFQWKVATLSAAQFTPDGRQIVAASIGEAAVLNASTGQITRTQGVVLGDHAQYSPDGGLLLAGNDLWNVQTWQPIIHLQGGAELNGQFSPQFSLVGRYLVTYNTAPTSTLAVWDTRALIADLQPVQPVAVFGSSVGHVAARFSPYGDLVVSVDTDGAARVWVVQPDSALPPDYDALLALAQTRVTRRLTCPERRTHLAEEIVCSNPTP